MRKRRASKANPPAASSKARNNMIGPRQPSASSNSLRAFAGLKGVSSRADRNSWESGGVSGSALARLPRIRTKTAPESVN